MLVFEEAKDPISQAAMLSRQNGQDIYWAGQTNGFVNAKPGYASFTSHEQLLTAQSTGTGQNLVMQGAPHWEESMISPSRLQSQNRQQSSLNGNKIRLRNITKAIKKERVSYHGATHLGALKANNVADD